MVDFGCGFNSFGNSRYRPYRYYSYGQIRITVSCVGEYLIRGVADIASVKTQILYAVFKAKEEKEKTNNSNIQIDEQKTVQNDWKKSTFMILL